MFPKMKKMEKRTYEDWKNIVYCVHIEIGNAVRCTQKAVESQRVLLTSLLFFCPLQ